MRQYLDAVQTILDRGTRKPNRTGVDTISTFNINYSVDLQAGFPLLTTKKISWKNIVVEMLWFLSGKKDVGILHKHGCQFWTAWVDGKNEVPSAYGNFWRRFPVHGIRDSSDHNIDCEDYCAYNDQIRWLVETLKRDPMSRRMVVSAWAPENAQTSKLPPCHCMFIVNVQNALCRNCDGRDAMRYLPDGAGKEVENIIEGPCRVCKGTRTTGQELCLHLTQRSCDVALGVPYNIASYALLAHLLSRFSGIPVGTFGHTLVDAHAYTCKADGSMAEYDHIPGLREQLQREPRPLPRLTISDEIKSLGDVEALLRADTAEVMRHFVLDGYDPWPSLAFKVAV